MIKTSRPWCGLLAAVTLVTAVAPLMAQEGNRYVIFVARRDTPAAEAAAKQANGQTSFAETTFHRALKRAAELLNDQNTGQVTVAVAAGEYVGQAGAGIWVLPPVINPKATLHLLGGLNEDFSQRHPFGMPTALVTSAGRGGPFITIERKSPREPSQLKELAISGFIMDAAPSNRYDAETNSIKKGESRSYGLLAFSYLNTEHLRIDSNVFINGAHGAFDPMVLPAKNGELVIDISNNFFLNNIKTMVVKCASVGGATASAINLKHNTFLLSWPFNPDATSSNVGAIELYHSGGAKAVNIEGNLFAYNPGGAMQHDWPDDRMPKLRIRGNLFYQNAALYANGTDDNGVIAGKFGTGAVYNLLTLDTIMDDFGYDVADNVVMDPDIRIPLAALQAANSYDVEAKDTVINQVRDLFGLNQDGGTVAIKNFSPALAWRPKAPPLPQNEEAKRYGVQWNGFWTPGN